MASLCYGCGEYIGQNRYNSPYCKCDRVRLHKAEKNVKIIKKIKEIYKIKGIDSIIRDGQIKLLLFPPYINKNGKVVEGEV